jgi:hypothetical protein
MATDAGDRCIAWRSSIQRYTIGSTMSVGVNMSTAARLTLGRLVVAVLLSSPAAAQSLRRVQFTSRDTVQQPDAARQTPGIQDNSFLIEEAYNQEPGVVQHISTFVRDLKSSAFVYQFTQEWPVFGIANQLSYSVPVVRADGAAGTGVGDIRLNYRYQLVGDGDAMIAVAPRLTAILPTGDYRKGRGSGGLGVEGWLPVSVVLSPALVVHANLGASLTPRQRNALGAEASARSWSGGGSIVWLTRSWLNVLLEAIYQRAEETVGPNQTARRNSVTLSPGLRWAHNFPSGLQIVPGIAIPLGAGPTRGERSILAYLSFEHPFSKASDKH